MMGLASRMAMALTHLILSPQDGKKKDKKRDDDSDDKKKDKKDKKKKDKKDKKKKDKKEKDASEKNGDDDYIKEALMGGKKDDDDLLGSDEDDDSVASEAGVDDQGAMLLAVEATRKYLAENPSATPKALAEFVSNQQMASALKSHDKVHIFVQAAITANFYKNKEMEQYAPVLSVLTNGNRVMERHLIGALECATVDKPKNFAVMLKQLYDEDALEEETILEWADEGRTEYTRVDEEVRAVLRGEAEPVVVWLQDADSDDSDDDESDEE